MQHANRFIRFACRMIVVLSACALIVSTARPDTSKDRKKAVKNLAKEIEQARFHKVYVPDFLDSSGIRSEKSCHFASSFSTLLSKNHSNFDVVNRIRAQHQLDELHISPLDLLKPELLSKTAQALGADAVLVGTTTISPRDATLLFSLRDSSGKEVHSMNYHEEVEPAFESNFPAVEDATSHFYYFAGLDGVSQPKCKYCPNPDYTDEARRKRIQGTVLMSVLLDENGTIKDARVVKSVDDSLAKQSINILKTWRLEPCRDLDGKAVAARVQVEITFHQYQ